LAEKHHDTVQQAHTHQVLAMAWDRHGDRRQALAHATRTCDLYRALDRPVREAETLNQIAWYAARLGEFDTARTHCQAALTLWRRHEPDGEAFTLDTLGYIAHNTGHHQQAIDYGQQALTLLRAQDHISPSAVADTLDRLGHPHVALGEHKQARVVWREALELYRGQDRDADVGRVRRQLDDLDHL
jgi:tetratricopeptide (TPR) repeat protein